MIIEAVPSEYQESYSKSVADGMEIFGIREVPDSSEEREALIGKIASLLEKAPYPKGRVDAELVRGRYLSSVGIIYGMILAEEFGWQMCWLREDDEEIEDGVDSLVSPDQSYFLAPIGVASKELYQRGGETRAVYEKIKRGDLPDVPPGSFHEIKP
jgi:hypothetical protein